MVNTIYEGEKMAKILKFLEESFLDYPDNESIAICVVMMGCDNGCMGCQSPLFANPLYEIGTIEVSVADVVKMIENACKKSETNKVVLSGGDVLSKYNIDFTKELLSKLSEYDVCIYTGHDIDYVKENGVSGFKYIKCGKFMLDKQQKSFKDDNQIQFASSNQILYNDNYEPLSKNGIYKF